MAFIGQFFGSVLHPAVESVLVLQSFILTGQGREKSSMEESHCVGSCLVLNARQMEPKLAQMGRH
jgi:hypothetical protein